MAKLGAGVVPLAVALFAGMLIPLVVVPAGADTSPPVEQYAPDRIIVKLTPDAAMAVMGRDGKTVPPGLAKALERARVQRASAAFADLWATTGAPKRASDKAKTVKAKFARRAARVPAISVPDLENILLLTLEEGMSVDAAVAELHNDPAHVVYAEPDRLAMVSRVPNDPFFSSSGTWGQPYADLWGLHQIGAEAAWEVSTGSEAVVVAIVDTGLDFTHPELAGHIWTNPSEIADNGIDDDGNGLVDDVHGWDFFCGRQVTNDPYGHSTHVAGTITANSDNGVGLAGLNWSAKIMPVKGFCDWGWGWDDELAQAMRYAADSGADVMNNSWGGYGTSQLIQEAVDYCYAVGCMVVASAGNSDWDARNFHPAGCRNVVCVAASDAYDQRAWFSNYGEKVDVTAPGVDILSLRAANSNMTDPSEAIGDGTYCRASGTSMAAPHVTGSLALTLAAHPDWPAAKVIGQVVGTADDIDANNAGYEGLLGLGRVNVGAALTGASPKQRVQLASTEVDDLWRNGNGIIEAGDRVRLGVTLKFATAAPETTATLATGDRYVKVVNRVVSFGAVPGWGEFSNTSAPFVFDLQPSCPQPHRVQFTLTVSSGGEQQVVPIEVAVAPTVPGWPAPLWSNTPVQAVLADLDRDRQQEALFAGWGTAMLHANGQNGSGWPFLYGTTTPCVGDLKGRGEQAIVVADRYSGQLWALTPQGYTYPGFPVSLQAPWVTSVSLGDLDGQPGLEIVAMGWDWQTGTYRVEAYRANGTLLPGWPTTVSLQLSFEETARPAIGDIDGDGRAEVVVVDLGSEWEARPKQVWAWHGDGTLALGFPAAVPSNWWSGNTYGPVLGDLNGDGHLEIVFSSGGEMYAVDSDGTLLWRQCRGGAVSLADLDGGYLPEIVSGGPWCETVFDFDGTMVWTGTAWFSSPYSLYESTVGDINDDGRPEIVQRSQNQIYAFSPDGQIVPGFPLAVGVQQYDWYWWGSPGAVAIGDVNGDSIVDLITGGAEDGNVYAYPTNGHYRTRSMEWPMRGGDLRNDGLYTLKRRLK